MYVAKFDSIGCVRGWSFDLRNLQYTIMKTERNINIVLRNIVPIAFIAVAAFCLWKGVDGWGWAFFLALLTYQSN